MAIPRQELPRTGAQRPTAMRRHRLILALFVALGTSPPEIVAQGQGPQEPSTPPQATTEAEAEAPALQPELPEGPGAVPPEVQQKLMEAAAATVARAGQTPRFGVAVREWQPRAPSEAGPSDHGLEIALVVPGGPADEAGLRRGDVLTRYNQQLLFLPQQLERLVKRGEVGEEVSLTYVRGDGESTAQAVLDAAPEQQSPPTHPSDVISDALKITHRVVRVISGTTTIALSTRQDGAYLEVSDAEKVHFAGPVRIEEEIPPEMLPRIQRVATLEDGRWNFKIPLLPPLKLNPEDGPRRPAPVPPEERP